MTEEEKAEELWKKADKYVVTTGNNDCTIDAYIAGYHECQKEHEWLYVKNGDYPKDNKPVLCILGDIDLGNCEVGYYNDVGSGEPWHFETYHLPDDSEECWGVSAWKEIVLPKESE